MEKGRHSEWFPLVGWKKSKGRDYTNLCREEIPTARQGQKIEFLPMTAGNKKKNGSPRKQGGRTGERQTSDLEKGRQQEPRLLPGKRAAEQTKISLGRAQDQIFIPESGEDGGKGLYKC